MKNWSKSILFIVCFAVAAVFGMGQSPSSENLKTQNMVNVTARHCQAYKTVADCFADPASVFYVNVDHNLRTTGGGDWQSKVMGDTAAAPATGHWIAVSNDATTPAAGDCAAGSSTCTLTGEIAVNGLSRASATFAHSNGTSSYTEQVVYTCSGSSQASQKTALFNAASSGTMIFENTYPTVTVNPGDTLTVTWTISI